MVKVPKLHRGNCICGRWMMIHPSFVIEDPYVCDCGAEWAWVNDTDVAVNAFHADPEMFLKPEAMEETQRSHVQIRLGKGGEVLDLTTPYTPISVQAATFQIPPAGICKVYLAVEDDEGHLQMVPCRVDGPLNLDLRILQGALNYETMENSGFKELVAKIREGDMNESHEEQSV